MLGTEPRKVSGVRMARCPTRVCRIPGQHFLGNCSGKITSLPFIISVREGGKRVSRTTEQV